MDTEMRNPIFITERANVVAKLEMRKSINVGEIDV